MDGSNSTKNGPPGPGGFRMNDTNGRHDNAAIDERRSERDHSSNLNGEETRRSLPHRGTPSRQPGSFPRISRPVELMRPSYDVVVIGSGYGGGVAASRMARGKQSVCVLERGKERWPGEFPEKTQDALKEVRVSGEFAPGDRRSIPGTLVSTGNSTGLYHFAIGDGQNVYMGNGLGGTSLVNANVFLEAHPAILNMKIWPEEIRGEAAWRKCFDRARDVLEPIQYPLTFPKLLKASLLQKQSEIMDCGEKFYRVPQTTRFEDGPNSTGVVMRASTLTGMDATGVNDGSKTTTLVTYLSDAWNWGAEMFCECEVRYITKAPGREGYIVYFAWHSANRQYFPGFYDDLMWVHAKKFVFLGAGSLGTTEILLRSRELGLDMSEDVGTEMSGNGDMLGFGYNTDYDANCMANPDPTPERPVGPCITSVLDLRDRKNPLEGFVVEDCAVPLALGPIMIPILEYLPDPTRPPASYVQSAVKLAARLGSKIFGPYFCRGSVARTAVYLIMSHDSSQGNLTLRKDTPVLTYSGVGRSKSVSRIDQFLEAMTAAVGGNFVTNPASTLLGGQQISVHPIGGARMSADGTGSSGVINHMGEVFKGSGTETYEGLIVCDGSIVPAAVGVNPLATITALAERSVELVAQKHGITIDYDAKNGVLDMFDRPRHPFPPEKRVERLSAVLEKATDNQSAGIEFSELMAGFIHWGDDVDDFEAAAKLARSRSESAQFFLTAKTWNISELINSSLHAANLTGTFSCSKHGGAFIVHRGTLQLFNQDPTQPETTNLTYDFDMISPSGRVLHFNGYKVVNSAAFLSLLEVWRQTTTLYVTITDSENKVVGRGTLQVHFWDFLRGFLSFQGGGPSLWTRLWSTATYYTYFAKQVIIPFLSPLGRLQWPENQMDNTYSAVAPSQTIPLTAADGVKTTMYMWDPTTRGKRVPTMPPPIILFIPGAATDHTMYALPTIERNAISYFCEAGYRAYCATHRVGRAMIAQEGYTTFDARRDIRAALEYIRKATWGQSEEGPQEIYVIAHCAGAVALSCGLLDGTIPGGWIRAITCSMVFMNPKFGKVDHLLSDLPIGLYSRFVSPYWDCSSSPNDTYLQRLINQLMRLYPAGKARETCRSVVCHRSEFVFGRLWTHENLNEATHARLDRFLGGTSIRSHQWLMRAGRLGQVTTNEPASENLVTPENIERLKGVPILFLSGTGNMVFTAENTDTSYTILCNAHGKEWYEREVFPGKGHLDAWMGPGAYQDVYPRVQRHVDKWMKKG